MPAVIVASIITCPPCPQLHLPQARPNGVPRVSPGCPPGVLANLRFPLLWETFFCGNGWAGGSFAKGGEMSSEAEIKF